MTSKVTQATRRPTTADQGLIWLVQHYLGGNGLMGVPILYRFDGRLDREALSGAICDIVDRHEVLRTTFELDGRTLYQFVHPEGEVRPTIDYTDLAGTADAYALARQQIAQFLAHDPELRVVLVKFGLWRIDDEDHLFVMNPHHIVTDAWSNALIMRDLAARYRARSEGRDSALPAVDWQFYEYANWRTEHIRGEVLDRHREYLLDQLRGAVFPVLREAPARAENRRPSADNEWFTLDRDLIDALSVIAERENTTLLVVLLSAYFMALHRLSKQPDLAVGSIFANRERAEVQETVGFFAKMQIIRARLGPQPTPLAVLREVRGSVNGALEHLEVSHLTTTMPEDAFDGVTGRPHDVVFHMLAVPPTAQDNRADFAGLRVRPEHLPDGLSCRFDLELLILTHPDYMEGYLRYATDQYPAECARRLVAEYLAATRELIAADPTGSAGAGH